MKHSPEFLHKAAAKLKTKSLPVDGRTLQTEEEKSTVNVKAFANYVLSQLTWYKRNTTKA